MKFPQTWAARLAHKIRQTKRLSKKSMAFLFLLAGSALVALTALLFARLADLALEWNALLVGKYPWFAWVALPLGLPLLAWFTRKFAPYTSGSGIPQVLAMLSAGQVQRVAFVFGTERTGLGTAEMARCQRWLTIPADADYSSLNLAQAVQIVAFSLRQAVLEREAGHARASGDATPTGAHSGEPPRTLAGQPTDVRGRGDEASLEAGVRHDGNRGVRPSERLADLGAVEGLYRHAESSLAALGTLDPARPRRLMARLRHLFGRTSLTAAEVDLLRGICRDIDRRTKGAQSAATGSAMPSAKDMT